MGKRRAVRGPCSPAYYRRDRQPRGRVASIHRDAESKTSRKLRGSRRTKASRETIWASTGVRHCLRLGCRACCNLDLLFFGYSGNRPVSTREDNGCDDQGERSENACLAYPQRCPSTRTHSYWIERTLNDAVPGSVQRDRWPDAARF